MQEHRQARHARGRRAAAAMVAAALASSPFWAGVVAAAAPPPLSADSTPVDIASSEGSGSFGTWIVDRFGLPAYRYEIDEETAPQAVQPELSGSRDAWHQVGNDRVVANAYNHGYVQLWSQDRLYQWMNHPDPAHDHFAGGFGYLNAGGKVLSTLYDDRPAGAETEREFGVGYFRKSISTGDVTIEEFVYAPFGDDPLLLHDVTITNVAASPIDGSWFEYWDVNPEVQVVTQIPRGYESPVYDPATRTLAVAELPFDVDLHPLTIFASALDAPVAGFDADTSAFFGSGTRAVPAAVAAGRVTDSLAPPSLGGPTGRAMFAFQSPVSLAPGMSVTFRYAYGYAHPHQIDGLLARYRSRPDPLAQSVRRWQRVLPKVDLGPDNVWLARELVWDDYTLRSDSTFEECADRHILSQGGYYQYFFGANEAFRDPLQHMLPMIWANRALARDVIVYSAREQPPILGAIPYGMVSACRRLDLGTADDLDVWLLWSTSEYVLASRDFDFLHEEVPYYGAGSGSLLDHLKTAFFHQEHVIGTGLHGEYLTGLTGDWNDFSTEFNQMTESNLVTAQTVYIYPRVADVVDRVGDHDFAADLRAAAARNLAVVEREFVPAGWFARGYSLVRQLGSGSIYSEPQAWALLAGAATDEQAGRLVDAYRRYLVGIGAPRGPSKIGAAIAPATGDGAEQNVPGLNDSTEFPGGAWYAVNGWMTWALADLDGRVPNAADHAWDEFTRNTLHAHAEAFPDHWDGLISVDDECAAYYQSPPSGCGIGLATGFGIVPGYDTQIMHQPAYSLFDLVKLAGVEATASGYRVVPHLPMTTFSIRLPLLGVAREPGSIRGYVRTAGGFVTMLVAPPPGVSPSEAIAWVDGSVVPHGVAGGLVRFTMRTSARKAADWAVTPPTS